MRREGYELQVSKPTVITRQADGVIVEPMELVMIEIPEEYIGIVTQLLSPRKGKMRSMVTHTTGRVRLEYDIPSRGLIGFRSQFLTDTRGTGIMSRLFHGYAPWKGPIEGRRNGVLISTGDGVAVAYALWNLEDRGPMFIIPGTQVYQGMIIGAHTRDNDLDVNPIKGKQLTNIRTTAKDEAVRLTPPILMTLEQAIAYIGDDELVEVTPKSIRLRKRFLDPNERKRQARAAEAG
jgi:GTP-binding protein